MVTTILSSCSYAIATWGAEKLSLNIGTFDGFFSLGSKKVRVPSIDIASALLSGGLYFCCSGSSSSSYRDKIYNTYAKEWVFGTLIVGPLIGKAFQYRIFIKKLENRKNNVVSKE